MVDATIRNTTALQIILGARRVCLTQHQAIGISNTATYVIQSVKSYQLFHKTTALNRNNIWHTQGWSEISWAWKWWLMELRSLEWHFGALGKAASLWHWGKPTVTKCVCNAWCSSCLIAAFRCGMEPSDNLLFRYLCLIHHCCCHKTSDVARDFGLNCWVSQWVKHRLPPDKYWWHYKTSNLLINKTKLCVVFITPLWWHLELRCLHYHTQNFKAASLQVAVAY